MTVFVKRDLILSCITQNRHLDSVQRCHCWGIRRLEDYGTFIGGEILNSF